MERLTRRADFLSAAKGARIRAATFSLQARDRRDRSSPRVGFTITKKTGNAVERNRIRRRLRAAMGNVVPRKGQAGFDYVVVARRQALTSPFDTMIEELERALSRLHEHKSGPDPARPRAKAGDGESE